uniref:Uncharacterized protein n=1 Tax=Anopheles melas TaxID=34690 RepID=A0A182UHK1_9DIPT
MGHHQKMKVTSAWLLTLLVLVPPSLGAGATDKLEKLAMQEAKEHVLKNNMVLEPTLTTTTTITTASRLPSGNGTTGGAAGAAKSTTGLPSESSTGSYRKTSGASGCSVSVRYRLIFSQALDGASPSSGCCFGMHNLA